MKTKLLIILILGTLIRPVFGEGKIRVFTIGDSTMANKKPEVFPETGWGQVLGEFFDDEVEIHNHAMNGRSSKSFISENRWQAVHDSLQPGDYLFIQFGHNDQKVEDPTRFTKPFGSYTKNLKKFVAESRAKGAIPVLFTSIVRRKFDEKGNLVDTHKDYPIAVRKLAKQMDVPLIDLQKLTAEKVQSIGVEPTKACYLWTAPNESFPEGRQDDTHLQVAGARMVAGLAAETLKMLNMELSAHVVARRPVVGLDHWYNRETNKKTGLPYHYTWTDTANSGFSQLGDLFKAQGALLKTIDTAANAAALGYLDVYIIVDPDTTSESEDPNYIEVDAVKAIDQWVNSGGTLLLMANDGPNCEFTHFNQLATTFGFHFEPKTLNPVVNRDWKMGAETRFEKHQLFEGVSKIYMKEVASISLDSPEVIPVLRDGGDGEVFIAETKYGKGWVMAIGDPWLYNEYIGHNLLPADFDNTKVAQNLCWYLLKAVKGE